MKDLIIKKLEEVIKDLNNNSNQENRDGIDEGISMVDDLIFHIKVRV